VVQFRFIDQRPKRCLLRADDLFRPNAENRKRFIDYKFDCLHSAFVALKTVESSCRVIEEYPAVGGLVWYSIA